MHSEHKINNDPKLRSSNREHLCNFGLLKIKKAEKQLNRDLTAKASNKIHVVKNLLPHTNIHPAGLVVSYYEVIVEIIKIKQYLSK